MSNRAADGLRLERDGAVACLLLDRAARKNAVTQAMWEAIPGLLDAARADGKARVLVLASADPGVFSAGADISEFTAIAADPERRRANQAAIRAAMAAIEGFPLPTVARVSGACVGGGLGLALACDIRLAAEDARLGITPARLGLVYSLADTRRLVAAVGLSQAKRILFTAQLVDGAEAGRIGLADIVTPTDRLAAETDALATAIAANAPSSLAGIKAICAEIAAGAVEDSEETLALFLNAYDGADFAEGVAAFTERRAPRF